MDIDILIIGAGVSDVYAAWRLSQKYPNLPFGNDKNNYMQNLWNESIPFISKNISKNY